MCMWYPCSKENVYVVCFKDSILWKTSQTWFFKQVIPSLAINLRIVFYHTTSITVFILSKPFIYSSASFTPISLAIPSYGKIMLRKIASKKVPYNGWRNHHIRSVTFCHLFCQIIVATILCSQDDKQIGTGQYFFNVDSLPS